MAENIEKEPVGLHTDISDLTGNPMIFESAIPVKIKEDATRAQEGNEALRDSINSNDLAKGVRIKASNNGIER